MVEEKQWRDFVGEAEKQLVAEGEVSDKVIKIDYWKRKEFREVRDLVCARASKLREKANHEEKATYEKLKRKYEKHPQSCGCKKCKDKADYALWKALMMRR